MKTVITIWTIAVLMFSFHSDSYSQNRKHGTRDANQKATVVDSKKVQKQIEKNKKKPNKNLGGPFILEEDFESGIFPPGGWTLNFGTVEWQQAFESGYGNGSYSTLFDNYSCNGSNSIFSPGFDPTSANAQLIFDFAYAPYGEEKFMDIDDLEIFYSTDGGNKFTSLVYYDGTQIQTAPATYNFFEPNADQWGTKVVVLPAGTNAIYFQDWEDCGNALYLDNIRINQGQAPALFYVDFETGAFPSNWEVYSDWTIATVSANCIGKYSALYPFYDCNYNYGEIYTSSFPPAKIGDSLFFDRAYSGYIAGKDSSADGLEIYYSTNYGASFENLISFYGFDLQTTPAVNWYFVPDCDDWVRTAIQLPLGTTSIRFQAEDNCSNNLYLDNIGVGGIIPITGDLSVEKLWPKGKLPLVYGVPDKISALIQNNSDHSMNDVKVYLNISGTNNLSDSLTIPLIESGDTTQVDFNGFMPVLNGFSTVTVSIPDDENNNNNEQTLFTEVNPNIMRYVDSNCCNGEVGWIGENCFVSKYKMSGIGQIRNVNVRLGGEGNAGQMVYAVVINSSNVVIGRSPVYKFQASDAGKYKSFPISDLRPVLVTGDYYVGIAQMQYVGDGFAFTPQSFQYDTPARPDASYGAGIAPLGTTTGVFEFPRVYGQNYAIESEIGNQQTIDAGVSDIGLTYEQYFSTATNVPTGKVFNAGTGNATFTVTRKITPGGYTSTKTITNLITGAATFVNFDPWTFTSGTTYSVTDSVVLSGDGNLSNNVMKATITPRVAKQLCVLWTIQNDRDSLVRAINYDGRYANNFDTVRMNYTGSYRPWKMIFANFRSEFNYATWTRDSLKSFLDNSTIANKKTLVVFGNAIAFHNDQFYASPADTIFYRQYLKSRTISDDWPGSIPASQHRFRGIGFFNGITQDSLSDPATPELIRPTNGGTAALKPQSVTGNNNDSCNAVSYNGTSFNSFFMTNEFSSLRATPSSPTEGPISVYIKIIDWIQAVNTNVKVLDLTLLLEGFYKPGTNSMIGDTVRVYLRNATNPYAIVDSAKDLLNSAGQASFVFNNAANVVNYYLHIKHRSALETWSKTTQTFVGNHMVYNFSTDSAKAYGNNMKKAGTRWVIFGGDVKQDGFVDLDDNTLIENDAYNFVSGYVKTDVNGDNFVDIDDQTIADNNAYNFVTKATPLSAPELIAVSEEEINGEVGPVVEYKIDYEVYEKYKNAVSTNKVIPDFMIIDNTNSSRIIRNPKR